MNEKLYSSALSNYKKWADNNKAELESDFKERHALCDEMQSYTKERLQNLTEEEFFNLIAPLWPCVCGVIRNITLMASLKAMASF